LVSFAKALRTEFRWLMDESETNGAGFPRFRFNHQTSNQQPILTPLALGGMRLRAPAICALCPARRHSHTKFRRTRSLGDREPRLQPDCGCWPALPHESPAAVQPRELCQRRFGFRRKGWQGELSNKRVETLCRADRAGTGTGDVARRSIPPVPEGTAASRLRSAPSATPCFPRRDRAGWGGWLVVPANAGQTPGPPARSRTRPATAARREKQILYSEELPWVATSALLITIP
jgi:hypothetical protein